MWPNPQFPSGSTYLLSHLLTQFCNFVNFLSALIWLILTFFFNSLITVFHFQIFNEKIEETHKYIGQISKIKQLIARCTSEMSKTHMYLWKDAMKIKILWIYSKNIMNFKRIFWLLSWSYNPA